MMPPIHFLTILLKQIYKEDIPGILIRKLGLRIIQDYGRSCSSVLWSRDQTQFCLILSTTGYCIHLAIVVLDYDRLLMDLSLHILPHLSVWESFC